MGWVLLSRVHGRGDTPCRNRFRKRYWTHASMWLAGAFGGLWVWSRLSAGPWKVLHQQTNEMIVLGSLSSVVCGSLYSVDPEVR